MRGFDIILLQMSHTLPSAAAFLLCVSCMAMQPAEPVGVPELMKTFDGLPVTDRTIWETVRRRELRQRFLERMYGLPPVYAETPDVRFTLEEPDKTMMDGMAVRRRMRIHYRGPSGADSFIAIAFIPKSDKPVPAFLLICNRSPKENLDPEREKRTGFWPAEQIVGRGYAAVAFFNGDIAPETYNPATAFLTGVFACYERPQDRTDLSWGTLHAWAWGASRVLDWLETEPRIDARRVAVVGHSRCGKTALIAGAVDERFAMTCANCSGCGGAKLAHTNLPDSEHYDSFLGSRVTYWFCGNFQRYCINHDRMDRPSSEWMDFDQHEWAALVAPRLLAIASASEDCWAGPQGEFHTARLASPAWELYGRKGLDATATMPPPDTPLQDGDVSYHMRTGKHDLTPYDWDVYMNFADTHGWRKEVK